MAQEILFLLYHIAAPKYRPMTVFPQSIKRQNFQAMNMHDVGLFHRFILELLIFRQSTENKCMTWAHGLTQCTILFISHLEHEKNEIICLLQPTESLKQPAILHRRH